MITKAGVCFEKLVAEWFDPGDEAHLRAWGFLLRTGSWPPAFLPRGVREGPGCRQAVREKAGGEERLTGPVRAWLDEHARLEGVVRELRAPGLSAVVAPLGERFLLYLVDGHGDPAGTVALLPEGVAEAELVKLAVDLAVEAKVAELKKEIFFRGSPVSGGAGR